MIIALAAYLSKRNSTFYMPFQLPGMLHSVFHHVN